MCISMIPKVFLLVEQIRPTTSQVDNLWTTISILFQSCTLEAVERVTDTFTTANDAFVLVIAERTFITDPNEGSRSHVGIANRAFAIAFVAKTTDGDSGSLATHDQIWVMARHLESWMMSF